MFGQRVLRYVPGLGVQPVVEVPGDRPSGLGWLEDGRLLLVAMKRRALLRVEADGTLAVHADLAGMCRGFPNDMIVGADGTAYVGDSGLPEFGQPGERQPGQLIKVAPDGAVRVVADDLVVPNGAVLTPDGSRLLLVEAHAGRIVSFPILADGDLGPSELFARVPPSGPGARVHPDGMCFDAEGAVWVCEIAGRRILRLLPGGAVEREFLLDGRTPVACVLGGAARRSLYVCASGGGGAETLGRTTSGVVLVTEVSVPGAGSP